MSGNLFIFYDEHGSQSAVIDDLQDLLSHLDPGSPRDLEDRYCHSLEGDLVRVFIRKGSFDCVNVNFFANAEGVALAYAVAAMVAETLGWKVFDGSIGYLDEETLARSRELFISKWGRPPGRRGPPEESEG